MSHGHHVHTGGLGFGVLCRSNGLAQPEGAGLAGIDHDGHSLLCRDDRGVLERYSAPDIFNTDQGDQFTSEAFIGLLKDIVIRISMDAR